MNNPTRLTGTKVILEPTQGGYQTNDVGEILRETDKWWIVKVSWYSGNWAQTGIPFRKSDGMAARNVHRNFPDYRLNIENLPT